MLVKSSIFAISKKRKNIDIMKKILYFAVALMMLTAVSCSKEEATNNTNTATNNGGGNNGGGGTPAPVSTIAMAAIGNGTFDALEDVLGIDFNGDGTLEYRLTYSEFENSGLTFDQYNAETGTNVVTVSEQEWDHIATLAQDKEIGNNMTPNGYFSYGDASFVYNIVPGTFYVGLRVKLADGIHYGWAKATVAEVSGSLKATWEEAYYNKTVNASIKAGQKQ